jgi:hypothetical protein
MDPVSTASHIPIACDPRVFTQEQRAAHVELAANVLLRWPKSRQELEDGYLFEYEGDEQQFLDVARWAASEHRCCPWATFSLQMLPFAAGEPGKIMFRYQGGSEGKAVIDAALQLFASDNLDLEPFLQGRDKLTLESFRPVTPQTKKGCGC